MQALCFGLKTSLDRLCGGSPERTFTPHICGVLNLHSGPHQKRGIWWLTFAVHICLPKHSSKLIPYPNLFLPFTLNNLHTYQPNYPSIYLPHCRHASMATSSSPGQDPCSRHPEGYRSNSTRTSDDFGIRRAIWRSFKRMLLWPMIAFRSELQAYQWNYQSLHPLKRKPGNSFSRRKNVTRLTSELWLLQKWLNWRRKKGSNLLISLSSMRHSSQQLQRPFKLLLYLLLLQVQPSSLRLRLQDHSKRQEEDQEKARTVFLTLFHLTSLRRRLQLRWQQGQDEP